MGVCTMGVATRGSTLSEELCLKLGFELDRGKRDFLITGPRASPASTWNTRGTRLTVGQRTQVFTHTHTRTQTHTYGHGHTDSTEMALNIHETQKSKSLDVQCTHLSDMQLIPRHGADTDRLRFLLLLLYCSEEALLLLLFGWLWRTQIQRLGPRPGGKTHNPETLLTTERDSVYCETCLTV